MNPSEEGEEDDEDGEVMLDAGLKTLCFNKLSINSRIILIFVYLLLLV